MRTCKAFLSSVLGSLLVLAAATGAPAWDWPRSCGGGGFTFTVVAGPCAVSDTANPSCDSPGAFTGIQYEVSGAPDHVATLVTKNNNVSVATGSQVYGACVGDPVTGLGKYSCHEKAVKVNPDASTRRFWVVVDGDKAPTLTSIVAKKGRTIQAFAIMGLGFDNVQSPFQTTKRSETSVFKGCAVVFEYDGAGNVTNAFNDHAQDIPAFNPNCSQLRVNTVDKLSISVDDINLGPLGIGQFGDGYISSGTNSCTTRVVGGRIYTWGSPCPN